DVNRGGKRVSISLWAQFEDDDAQWQAMLSKGESDNYRVAVDGTPGPQNAAGYAGGAPDIIGTTNIQDTGWHHIVATTVNGGGVTLYVDGALQASGAGPATIASETFELWIGNNPEQAARMWDGLIDDVAIWDRALNLTEVQVIHNAGLAGTSLGEIAIPEPSTFALFALGLVGLLGLGRRRRNRESMMRAASLCVMIALIGVFAMANVATADIITDLEHHYTFDNTSDRLEDSAGTNDGNQVGSPSYVTDSNAARGDVLSVSSGNYAELPNVGTIPTGNSARTFAVWAMIDSYDDNAGIWRHGANANQQDFSIELTATAGRVTFNGWNADMEFDLGSPQDTGTPSTWHHIAVTFDGTTTSVYTDGVLASNTSTTNPEVFSPNLNTASNPIRLGGPRFATSAGQFNGQIDDFRVYSRALSSTDVLQLFNATATVQVVPEPSTFVLFALGMVTLCTRRRRRNRS
ncbi:MAG: LamG domain-containing protein, partial [Pirellulales bacterium]|nr:LamG domain-containing protein [Pirellulales bacterium]